ncbi:MAG: M48 family metalloprotease [Dissulfurimicrobium sp.]|uniref:M48 family metalloprotease n=1 Tax=Dissulfurimicrobium TaxID=1769732 RepID=UPI003C71D392
METYKTYRKEKVTTTMARRTCCVFLIYMLIGSFVSTLQPKPSWAMMSIEQERKLGEKLLKTIETQVTLINDPEVVGYVRDVGERILKSIDDKYFNYRFFVIKNSGINAFAVPGGEIFVNSGLLEVVDNEDELACVLAHEMGHVQGRHIARRMDSMQKVNIATAAAAVAGLFLGGGQAGSAVLATSGALNATIGLKYSREDEEEADRRAYQYLCKAGYSPKGLIEVMKKIQQYRWLGNDSVPSYLQTHPTSSQRITYLEDLIASRSCKQTAKENNFELKKIQIKTKIYEHDPNILANRYKRELSTNPDDIFLLYGLAQSLLTAKEYEDAIAAFKRLVSIAKDHQGFVVDLGIAYFTAGRYKDAISTLAPYSQNHPEDIRAKFYLASAYLEQGSYKEAATIFRSLKDVWPDRPALYFNLGRCLVPLNEKGEAHYYFYLYYKANGNREMAIYHRAKAIAELPVNSGLYEELKNEGKGEGDENQEPPKKTGE